MYTLLSTYNVSGALLRSTSQLLAVVLSWGQLWELDQHPCFTAEELRLRQLQRSSSHSAGSEHSFVGSQCPRPLCLAACWAWFYPLKPQVSPLFSEVSLHPSLFPWTNLWASCCHISPFTILMTCLPGSPAKSKSQKQTQHSSTGTHLRNSGSHIPHDAA